MWTIVAESQGNVTCNLTLQPIPGTPDYFLSINKDVITFDQCLIHTQHITTDTIATLLNYHQLSHTTTPSSLPYTIDPTLHHPSQFPPTKRDDTAINILKYSYVKSQTNHQVIHS